VKILECRRKTTLASGNTLKVVPLDIYFTCPSWRWHRQFLEPLAENARGETLVFGNELLEETFLHVSKSLFFRQDEVGCAQVWVNRH